MPFIKNSMGLCYTTTVLFLIYLKTKGLSILIFYCLEFELIDYDVKDLP